MFFKYFLNVIILKTILGHLGHFWGHLGHFWGFFENEQTNQ
jgi:hypothetical protein